MRTLLLKTATLVLCLTAAGCSNFKFDNLFAFDKDKPLAQEVTEAAKARKAKIDHEATAAWLDKYEQRLRDELKGSKFEVSREENTLIVTAPVDSSFNPDRPGLLMPAVLAPITKVAKLVEADPETGVLVLGHADSSGDDKRNRELSQERASAVASIFRLSGLRSDRLIHKGVGSDMPRAANDSKEGRALNRRVEVVLTQRHPLVALLARYVKPAEPKPELAASQSK